MTEKITPPALPELNEILAEFESGKIPRSSTWQQLISGLYLNTNQVQEIENWYKEIQDWYSATVDIKEGVNGQYIQIEIWKKDIENNVDISKNTIEEIKSFKEEASKNALQAESEADRATDQANRSTTEADRSETEADRSETEANRSETAANRSEGVKKVNEIDPDIDGNVDISFDNLKNKEHHHQITDLNTIGTILGCVSPNPPTGWALCDGSFFDKNKLPELYKVLNDEQLPFIPPENGKWSIINHGYDGDLSVKLDITSWKKLPPGLNNGSTDKQSIQSLAGSGGTFVVGFSDGYASISTDSGKTWSALPRGLNSGYVTNISANIKSLTGSGRSFVAGFRHGFASVSTDGGRTWRTLPRGLNSGYDNGSLLELAASGEVFVAGFDSGHASISTDSGRTWKALPRGLHCGSYDVIFSSLTGSENTFIAGFYTGEISISTDSGRTWKALSRGLNCGSTSDYLMSLAGSENTFIAGFNTGHASISTDSGRTWSALPRGLNCGSTSDYLMSLAAFKTVFVAGFGNGYNSISTDSGRTWKALPRGLNTGTTSSARSLVASGGVFIAGISEHAAIGTSGPTLYSTPLAEKITAENKISEKDREVVRLFKSDPQTAFEKLLFENIRGNETLEELDNRLISENEKQE